MPKGSGVMGSECVTCREIELEYFVGTFSAVGCEVHNDSATQLPVGRQVLPERQDRSQSRLPIPRLGFPGRRSNR
jgi:hypothetical protein